MLYVHLQRMHYVGLTPHRAQTATSWKGRLETNAIEISQAAVRQGRKLEWDPAKEEIV
jgi:hypothetical protein